MTMTTDCGHGPKEHPPETEAATLAFFEHLTKRDGMTSAFIAGAIYGYTLRKHVDSCHPGEVEETFALGLEREPEDRRDGFAVGYRYGHEAAT